MQNKSGSDLKRRAAARFLAIGSLRVTLLVTFGGWLRHQGIKLLKRLVIHPLAGSLAHNLETLDHLLSFVAWKVTCRASGTKSEQGCAPQDSSIQAPMPISAALQMTSRLIQPRRRKSRPIH